MPDFYNDVTDTNLGTSTASGTKAAGDRIFLNQGHVAYAAGADLSGTDLLLFQILAGFRGSFATTLKLVCDRSGTGQAIFNGGWTGNIRLESSSASGIIKRIEVEPAASGTMTLGAMDNDILVCKAGVTTIEADCDADLLHVTGGAKAVVQVGSDALGALHVGGDAPGSELETWRDFATAVVSAGGRLRGMHENCTPTSIDTHPGGLVEWAGGNVGTLNLRGGTLDLRRMRRLPTFTTVNVYARTVVLVSQSGLGLPTKIRTPDLEYAKLDIRNN